MPTRTLGNEKRISCWCIFSHQYSNPNAILPLAPFMGSRVLDADTKQNKYIKKKYTLTP